MDCPDLYAELKVNRLVTRRTWPAVCYIWTRLGKGLDLLLNQLEFVELIGTFQYKAVQTLNAPVPSNHDQFRYWVRQCSIK